MTLIRRYTLAVLVTIGLIHGCAKQPKIQNDNTLFKQIHASESGIDFINSIVNEQNFNIFLYRNFYNGGGVAIGDINNDGLVDIYLTSNMGSNKLYLNEGDFKFTDITELAGVGGTHAWSTGVVLVDINGDGLLDIYVTNAGNVAGDDQKNELFINEGDLRFSEQAEAYGLADSGFTTHAAFFDYDGDGDLDVYILNNSFIPVNSLGYSNKRELRSDDWDLPEMFRGGGDRLLRNDNGYFVDVSEEAGIYGSLIGFGLGVTIGDVNNDMLPDIYVSNDFYERDYLYINQGDGTFKEDIKSWVGHMSLSSMGADMADINNDGLPEIFVTDMLPEGDERLKNTSEFERFDIYNLKVNRDFYHQYMQNTLQLNNGNNTFSEVAFYSGVAATDWSWGALMFDMDNDGYRDIYVSNGIYHDLTNQDFIDFFANDIIQRMILTGKKEEIDSIIYRMPSTPVPNYAFRNNRDLTFTNMAVEWGLSIPSFSNGAAYGDLNNDGDLDLVVNNVNQPLFLFRNMTQETNPTQYLQVVLEGEAPNTFGIGSVVQVYYDGQINRQELITSRGFQSSVDYKLHFGLGGVERVDSVEVIWPDRRRQVLYAVEANQLLKLSISDANSKFIPPVQNSPTKIFTPVAHDLQPHIENSYIDFDYEALIPRMSSREGPAMAVADVNGDGRDDLFIGGATGQPGQIYLQNARGRLVAAKHEAFERDRDYEDTYALFFDATGNGFPDLYVGSGGNDKDTYSALLSDRIYVNDGRGNFSAASGAVPDFRYNTSVVAPCDFDGDGDIDLFVGSLSVSRIYGVQPRHYLLENDGKGNFSDVTESRAFRFRDLGMVTDAVWHDMDGDGSKDLVIVGHWMAPSIFLNSGRRLTPAETNLSELTGWWNAVAVSDINNNGQPDLILGNYGLNSIYKTSIESPARMFVNDFDENGTIEQILTRHVEGRDYPVPLKKELLQQLVSLKKENLSYAVYATRSIQDLFPKDLIENSMVRQANTFASTIAYQSSNLHFDTQLLPAAIQFSQVNDIHIVNDENGKPARIMLAGNDTGYKPQFGRQDAAIFQLIDITSDGLKMNHNHGITGWETARNLKFIQIGQHNHLLLGINNGKPLIFRYE